MAKVQSRGAVSLNRKIFDRATEHAAAVGRSLSRIVEDLLLAEFDDAAFTAAIHAHRESEASRTSPRPQRDRQRASPRSQRPRHDRPGRPTGVSGSCSACGGVGHRAGPDGLCSPTYVAARLVMDRGWSVRDAANESGVATQGVYACLRGLAEATP